MRSTFNKTAWGISSFIGLMAWGLSTKNTEPSKPKYHQDSIQIWALDSNGVVLDSSFLNESGAFKFDHLQGGRYTLKTLNRKLNTIQKIDGVEIENPKLLTKLNSKFKYVVPSKHVAKIENSVVKDSILMNRMTTTMFEKEIPLSGRSSEESISYDGDKVPMEMMATTTKSSSVRMESTIKRADAIKKTSSKLKSDKETVEFDDSRKPSLKTKEMGHAKVLTAGIWNDLENWDKFEQTHKDKSVLLAQSTWGIYLLDHRFGVEIYDKKGNPVIGEKVSLKTKNGNICWTAQTDNRGKVELWYNPFEKSEKINEAFFVEVTVENKIINLGKIKPTGSGYERYIIQEKVIAKSDIDVCFVVDATGSMGDEINFLKEELMDVMMQFQKIAPCSPIRLSSVFYRDRGDEYLTKNMPFTNRIDDIVSFVSEQYAGGGGDFPEAVHSGLKVALEEFEWNEKALTKIIFLILDAPPHTQNAIEMREMMKTASNKGIKIIPITASGIDQSTEFCMKYLAAGTGGDYIYITDHSGVGNSHIKPTGVKEDVDLLNTQILKSLQKYSLWDGCKSQNEIEQPIEPRVDIFGNSELQISSYPNPASNYINIKTNEIASHISIFNVNGQMVKELKNIQTNETKFDVLDLSDGLYVLKVIVKGQAFSNKFFVSHQNQQQQSRKD